MIAALLAAHAAPTTASARPRPRIARARPAPVPAASPSHPSTQSAAPLLAQAPAAATGLTREDALARALEFTVTIEGEGIYGAGVLVDPANGRVLTALHVVEPHRSVRVSFVDGTTTPGTVAEMDHALDLAIVHIAPQPRRPAPPIADATRLRPAEELYAIGCPRRLGFTITRGIVSFAGRPMDGQRFIQTDLPINEGNSGGPVLDSRGELVGVMSFILRRAQGLSFALPINYAVERFPEVRNTLRAAAAPAVAEEYLARFRKWRGDATPAPDRMGPIEGRL